MSKRNPMMRPDVIEKMIDTRTRNGTNLIRPEHRGGNGKLTEPQKLLAAGLKGSVVEYAVGLGMRMNGYPTCYKVDLAFPEVKLAIEVDGRGHSRLLNQVRDKKKEEMLARLGWTVLRVTNKEVLESLQEVVSIILSCHQDMSRSTI
jgi:hypothetical protein